VERSPREIKRVAFDGWSCNRRANGANFCHVERIRPVVRSSPWRTSGSQEWRGASPIFKARAMVIIVTGRGCVICWMSHWPVNQALVVLANKSMAAAVAWVRKYLVVASTARGWWCCAIRGMMARVLISKPIQASSQWELINVIVVPSPRPNNKVAKM